MGRWERGFSLAWPPASSCPGRVTCGGSSGGSVMKRCCHLPMLPDLLSMGVAAPNRRPDTQLLAFPVQGNPTLTLCCWSLLTSPPGLDTPWHKSPGPCSRQDKLQSHCCPELPVGPG